MVWVVDAKVGEACLLLECFETAGEKPTCSAFSDEQEKCGEDGHNDGGYVEDPSPKIGLGQLVSLPRLPDTYHPMVAAIYDPYMGPTRRPPVVAQAHM